MAKLLEVNNLQTQFNTEMGLVKAVNDVSYYVDEHEVIGVVGESGCGKSVTQLSVLQSSFRSGENSWRTGVVSGTGPA